MRRAAAVVLLACACSAFAEKADQDKPTQIEANRMSADDVRRMNIFEGNVVLTKGTLTVRADRIVVRQDAEGYQSASATGAPVRFKQRQDPKEGEKRCASRSTTAIRKSSCSTRRASTAAATRSRATTSSSTSARSSIR
jgi:lipopolysaccharide export system protein LptA